LTIYQNAIDIVFRLDTGLSNLDTATSIKILVKKPSGSEVEWTATQYSTTPKISYTTVAGDLDEVGQYILQSSVGWGQSDPHLGDAVTITVDSEYTVDINVAELIDLFSVYYRYISVQTFDEYNANPESGTDAEILYDEFDTYTEMASDELPALLNARSIPNALTPTEKKVCLCHLVADYFEMGNTDWNFKSENMGSGVSFSRGDKTGPREALDNLLAEIQKAIRFSRRPSVSYTEKNLVWTKDNRNYPRRFKKTQMPAFEFSEDGFDSEQVYDLGQLDENDYTVTPYTP